MSEFGYAGKITRVDLTEQKVSALSTANYAGRFLGGRGIAAKIYWDETTPETKAADAQNCLVYMTGPLAGFTRLAGEPLANLRKIPGTEPEAFSYSNLGGSWGAWLKMEGHADGLVVTGNSEKPVYLYIEGGDVKIKDGSHLWGKTAFDTEDDLAGWSTVPAREFWR